uniref:SAT4 family membrane protein n=1 Tax=Emericella nidulans (strain FGSC A4 / ATCC 38163 / CBS 112.46 / NRRL 194 / M139) TaxID=227321 RepID=SAT4_EMENI|nr:RecName: Full=SAT4 family membrane protein [Aspergillus nidulans FGSC A4]
MFGAELVGRETGGQSTDQPYSYRDSARTWDTVTQSVLKAPGWEDSYAVITIEADKHGNGAHQETVAPSDLRQYAKLANASQILYAPLIFVTKLSIFLLYLRVFASARRGMTYLSIHLLIWFNLAFYLANFFLKIFQCIPRAKIWDSNTSGHCININIPILVTAAINVVSDLLMLCLPIICVWRLQMSIRRKLGISAIFAAGIFGCFASIMRLEVSVRDRNTKDPTYDWYTEITCGILASCLPALPTFFRHFFGKARTMLSRSRTRGSSNRSQDRSLEKATELYTLTYPRGQKHHIITDNRLIDQDRELDDDRTQIFSGPSYAVTEARVEGRTPLGQRAYHGDDTVLNGEDGSGHCRGILKVVEVDVESGPGHPTVKCRCDNW